MPISIYTRGQHGQVAAIGEGPHRGAGWCAYCDRAIDEGESTASVREFDAARGDSGLWVVALVYGSSTVFHAGCADIAAASIAEHGGPDGPLIDRGP